ncbi:endonuclease [Lactobacillus phage LJ]|uniref:Putative endonuclease n=1 Tax=Lactobacillus phage LJ TaxID=2041454 RepID=A0A2D1GPF1_9CAUD|nr:endonuclease [Lactobacillus phage LJ]ATN93874.1 putative endonuclease [Lactobacillus phage LJ]
MMNSIRIQNGKVFVNGIEVGQVEKIHFKAEANDPVEVEMKWLVPVRGLDVSVYQPEPRQQQPDVDAKQQKINDLTSKLEAAKQANNGLSQAIKDAQSIKDYSDQAVKSVSEK